MRFNTLLGDMITEGRKILAFSEADQTFLDRFEFSTTVWQWDGQKLHKVAQWYDETNGTAIIKYLKMGEVTQ